MLAYILIVVAVILIPLICAFVGDEPPDNTVEHTQQDARRDDDEPELFELKTAAA